MHTRLAQRLCDCFGQELLDASADEWGVRIYDQERPIRRVGWAAMLTPDVVQQCVSGGVDLLVTFHDAWPFLYQVREESLRLLGQSGLGHVWVHAPLGQADFGSNAFLLERIGCASSRPYALQEGFYMGRIGALPEEVPLEAVAARLEAAYGEAPRFVHDGGRPCRCVAVVTGGGCNTEYMRLALEEGRDTYITGEYNAYLAIYARGTGLNVLVFSHTYTERYAALRLAERLFGADAGVEFVEIVEEHL